MISTVQCCPSHALETLLEYFKLCAMVPKFLILVLDLKFLGKKKTTIFYASLSHSLVVKYTTSVQRFFQSN